MQRKKNNLRLRVFSGGVTATQSQKNGYNQDLLGCQLRKSLARKSVESLIKFHQKNIPFSDLRAMVGTM